MEKKTNQIKKLELQIVETNLEIKHSIIIGAAFATSFFLIGLTFVLCFMISNIWSCKI